MPGQIRPGSGTLLQLATLELGCYLEKDRPGARAADMRGGISMPSKRYARANNRLVGYDPSKRTNYTIYSDANNLYGWAMRWAMR